MNNILLSMLLVGCLGIGTSAQTKTERPPEAKAEMPALTEFHEVIAQIWHTAWPDKNTKMLVDLLSEVEKGAASIAEAPLPGILHEREAKWGEGVKRLQSIVAEYKSATVPLDEKKLLSAAEQLHMQYEALVRIIRPALKELDTFHGTLYVLYHTALPEKSLAHTRELVKDLTIKMADLRSAKLSERQKDKSDAFEKARAALGESVDALAKAAPTGSMETLTPLIEGMHSRYEELDKVFQ